MSRRDSNSKRHPSRFDREPSPKRYRRDGKQEREREREKEREREGERERDRDRGRERERERVTMNGGGHADRDQRNHLANHSKQANRDAADEKKSNDRNEASKHSSDPIQPPRSHSYHQHDEGRSARQVGRSTGQREAGGKVFTQNREHNERVETGKISELRNDKSHSKLDDNLPRRAGFSERKDDQAPTTRRRPAFREKKIPVDSGDVLPATTLAEKSSHPEHPSERNERKEEKSSNPNHLDKPEKQTAEDRLPNRNGGAWRDGFSSRGRYGSSGGNGHYRGRDKIQGRQGFQPTARTEKWKHDLYQEVNKDPLPKNEDDQIAKLEALLAS